MEEKNQYLKTLDAIETFNEYLQGEEPSDVHKALWNLEYYLDHTEEFSNEESRDIDRGLARVAVRYMLSNLSKK
jgi:hypothetical protein